jgi:hypothetical protein
MSVLLDEEDTIEELTEWFETVWSIYNPPKTEQVKEYIETTSSTPSPAQTSSSVTFSSGASPGRASLVTSTSNDVAVDNEHQDSHTKLVKRVSNAPDPEWIDSYFDLLDDLISVTGLSDDDPRLVTSLPQDSRIPVSINNRYVLVAMRRAGSEGRGEYRRDYNERVQEHNRWATTGFILGSDVDNIDELVELADYHFPFDPLSGEDESDTPHYVEYIGGPNRVVARNFKQVWLDAATQEVDRATSSPYKRHHESVVYEAARNQEYREKVIHEAFEQD